MKVQIVLILFSYAVTLHGSRERQCGVPELKNGSVKLRQRGRIVRFSCKSPYKLFGSAYAGCIGYKWDTPVPFCAKSGCAALSRSNALVSSRGGQATLVCHHFYIVSGNRVAYCDGREWDRALGECVVSNQSIAKKCDFEREDICGWTHDPVMDFDWQRALGVDNHKRLRTGPQHDHTTMTAFGGHYMLLEAVDQVAGNRARLISPVYPASYSRDACLRFYYHMYGSNVDTLRVYVKPISVDLDEIGEDDNQKYIYFELKGNQKNAWRESFFDIDLYDEEFQIVFEGVAGKTHLSDIAIDDVALMQDAECRNLDMTTAESEIEAEPEIPFSYRSCENRCNEERSTITSASSIPSCDCNDECLEKDSCCSDYKSVCSSEGVADTMPTFTTEATVTVETRTAVSTTPQIDTTKATSTTTKKTTTESTTSKTATTPSTTTRRPTTISTTTRRPTTISTTTRRPTTTSTTTRLPTTTSTTKRTPTTTSTSIKTTHCDTSKPTTPTTTPTTTSAILSTNSTERAPVVIPSGIDDHSEPFYIIDHESTTLQTKATPTASSSRTVAVSKSETNASWQTSKKYLNYQESPRTPIATFILPAIGAACVIVVIIVLARRRYVTRSYRRNQEPLMQKEMGSSILYSTSDEQLDFTLQTPNTVNS